jgi:hypothetical protein
MLALALPGCGGGGGGGDAGSPPAAGLPASDAPTAGTSSTGDTVASDGLSWPAATKTALGTPSGAPSSASIGAAGGTLASPDGRLELTVPAGALAATTTVSIQPISSTAPGAIGAGYRLQPEGVTFAAPVTLRMTYSEADVAGGSPQTLGIATQAADGSWRRRSATVDTVARTVSVTTTHFSDWSLVQGLQLRPGQASVRVGQKLSLDVAYCYAGPTGGAYESGYACDTELLPLNLGVGVCAVNGVAGGNATVGTVSYADGTATYVAPASVPSPATVAVSCEARPGNGRGAKQVLVANVTVIGGYSGTVGGSLSFRDVGEYSMAPATLGPFTVVEADSNAGDVTKWVARGTAMMTATTTRCSTATAEVPIEVTMLVWDPASESASGEMAKAYSIVVLQTGAGYAPGVCDGEASTVPVVLPTPLVTDAPGTLGNSQKYTDIATLSGSADIGFPYPGLGAAVRSRMTWSLSAR